jgi:hypothetical protein
MRIERSHFLFKTTLLAVLCWPASEVLAGEVLRHERIVALENGDEFHVVLRATVKDSSWRREGQAGTLLKLVVDDRYDQHVVLIGGVLELTYDFLVGPLTQGSHALRIEWDNSWTPTLKLPPQLSSVEVRIIDRGDPSQEPILRAPILHLRRDTQGRFSDVPLLMYWDYEHRTDQSKWIVYTVIFSNEDGGTDTERLMARWGRTTDVEWCYAYAMETASLREEYQGPDHKTLAFRGKYAGRHPVLYTKTVNNNFSESSDDATEFRVRPFPMFADLRGRARENVMDQYPWTYRVMADEMIRESKIESPADAASLKVSDLRNYAYLEVCAQQRGTELFFEVQLKAGARWHSSTHGDPQARIARNGCSRSTIELPEGTQAKDLRALRIQCTQAPTQKGAKPVAAPEAVLQSVPKLFLLDSSYQPAENLLNRTLQKSLKPGQSLLLELTAETPSSREDF